MKRNRLPRRTRKTPDMDLAMHLARQFSLSSSQIEDNFWGARLSALVNRLLAAHDEETLMGALDHLYQNNGSPAYDGLAATIEACAETRLSESPGGLESLLVAIPVLAWSRLPIPSGNIPPATLSSLSVHLQAHVLAADAKLALADMLFSPDQLPQNYVDTSQLLDKLIKAALHSRPLKLDEAQLGDTIEFLSDARYLVGVVMAPKGAPMFRWQEDDGDAAESFRQWVAQGGEVLRPLLPACAVEFLPLRAYHASVRDADRASRPWSLRAAVAFLQTMLNITADQLCAVIAPFHDHQLEEYRIGFTRRQSKEVIHGVVWPLLDADDEINDPPAQIEAILKEAGVRTVISLEQRFPMEFCDDCGAPLYPNPEGEPVHAELPEEQMDAAPKHLH